MTAFNSSILLICLLSAAKVFADPVQDLAAAVERLSATNATCQTEEMYRDLPICAEIATQLAQSRILLSDLTASHTEMSEAWQAPILAGISHE